MYYPDRISQISCTTIIMARYTLDLSKQKLSHNKIAIFQYCTEQQKLNDNRRVLTTTRNRSKNRRVQPTARMAVVWVDIHNNWVH